MQAAFDLDTALHFPIHWGKLDLVKHNWTESIERAVRLAGVRDLPIVVARIGQTFRSKQSPIDTWWTLD